MISLLPNRSERIKQKVLSGDYDTTKAGYLKTWTAGVWGTDYIECYYIVKGIKYTRSIKSHYYYNRCQHTPQNCVGIRFWAIYLKDEPRNCIIDLSNEIQDIKEPKFPATLNNFE